MSTAQDRPGGDDGPGPVLVHHRTVESREGRHKVDWRTVVWVNRYRFSCSCGWRTGWVENYDAGLHRADTHAIDGQTAFAWPV